VKTVLQICAVASIYLPLFVVSYGGLIGELKVKSVKGHRWVWRSYSLNKKLIQANPLELL